MIRRLIVCICLLAPLVLVAQAESYSGFCADSQEVAMLGLINHYRMDHGLPILRLTQTLGDSAEHHSRDMTNNNYFSHTLSNGTTWSQNMTNHGYRYSTFRGENIAAGNSDARKTFEQWKNSPGHNANMLGANYHAIGIGRAYKDSSKYDWYWTTDFGGYKDASACRA